MLSITRALLACSLFVSSTLPALAALPSLNPKVPKDGVDLRAYQQTPTAHTLVVPKAFLDKTYLFGGMVEAATDNCLTIGSGSQPIKVRFKVEGDKLLMLADQRDTVPNIGGSSEDVLNRYPIAIKGDKVEIDFADPELKDVSVLIGSSGYNAQHPGYLYDVVNDPGFVGFGEKYIIQGTDPDSQMPSRITLAIKYYLKECQPSSYKPKEYTDSDFARYGFFLTDRPFRKDDGNTEERSLVNRRDLSKKIVYLLHPSIPEKFRQAYRDAILSWNKVFKQSNGVEPIEVRDGTDAQVPGDVRLNVLYWVDYPTPFGGGAIGPHVSDPDTGEILQAAVIFYAGAFRDEIAGLRKEASAGKDAKPDEQALKAALQDMLKGVDPGAGKRRNRGFKLHLGTSTELTFDPGCEFPADEELAIAARAGLDITQMTDDQAMERIVREVIPHEIGHTLGLRHNFKATADLKNLPDGAESTTVMDYVTSLEGLLGPGPYDYAAIAYGYDGDKSLYDGKDFYFATDGSQAVDPLSNQFDSGDPLAFYTGRYDHFSKLRDVGLFSSMASYGRAQRRTLEAIRKYVNRDKEGSAKAYDFLLKALTDKGVEPPFNAIERLQAMMVLTNDQPKYVGNGDPRARFAPLKDAEQAALAQALVKNVVPNGPDIFELRVAMVEALKGMNNIYGYKGLEALGNAYKKIMDAAGSSPAGDNGTPVHQLPPREQELALRIQQAVASYFNH